MNYWLMKSEPLECSITSLQSLPNQTIEWFGVRNYQARNFMRDEMQLGDLAYFWHSSCDNPGIYGVVEIASKPHPDTTQFNPSDDYYDPKSTQDNPRWWCVDVKFKLQTKYISISELRQYKELENMQVLKKGNRLSITKISLIEWKFIQKLLKLA